MRQRMPKRDYRLRVKDFKEVALGYGEQQAIKEAERCLQCKRPKCIEACPVEIDIPAFVSFIAKGDFSSAIKRIKQKNNLPAICGRVCPQETQCEQACLLSKKKSEPLAIGYLERFVADWELNEGSGNSPTLHPGERSKERIAVVGSGPAGLTCAGDLAKMGYGVTIFESLHSPGGVLTYGIPEFRLPKEIVNSEINYVKSLGVKIQVNMLIGKIFTIEELFQQGFKAIFIGTGAGLPQFLGIPGENLNRVYSANEFLTRINLMKAYSFPEFETPINVGKKIGVIGGGNVAIDSARCALRLGVGEVTVVYRRTEKEMPARIEEIRNAKEEGVKFHFLSQPIRMIGDEKRYVVGLECIQMKLGKPDASGRRRPLPINGSLFLLNIDTVVVAIGQSPNPLLVRATPGLETGKKGVIVVDRKTGKTSLRGVFAGGDITTGSDTVISAMGAGRRAALAINRYLRQRE